MIDAHGLIAEICEDAVERRAYDRSGEVPDVEGLCDIDGAEIYADRPALALFLARGDAPVSLRARSQPLDQGVGREEEIEVSSRDLRPAHDVRGGERFRKLLRNDGRGFPHRPRELETRQSEVPELCVLGDLERRLHFLRGERARARRRYTFRDLSFKHIKH